mmetsp:Transcript_72304/g.212198  ORF Transcript_72304/g.212198 Transcript_72304/m.212198 type:complete len:515 (+) Transcript_72304:69-1613(+)
MALPGRSAPRKHPLRAPLRALKRRSRQASTAKADAAHRLLGAFGKRVLQEHEAIMRRAVRRGVYAGCASTVIHRGEAVFQKGFGCGDLEKGKAFRHDTICRIYCQTKSYTIFVANVLADRGLLDLDAPVSRYIPSMKQMTVLGSSDGGPARPARTTMLVRHLLSHAAGFSYQADFNFPPEGAQRRYEELSSGVEGGRIRSLEQYVDELAKLPLCYEPGDRYEYGHSIDVLGRVMEVACGQDLRTVMQEELFKPLGMVDTDFHVSQSKLERLGGLYGNATTWGHLYGAKVKRGMVPVASKPGLLRIDGVQARESAWCKDRVRVLSGGGFLGHNRGGLVSTARDTEAFVRMLLRRGLAPDGTRLVSSSTLARMEKNQLVGEWRPPSSSENAGSRWCMLGDMIRDSVSVYYQQGGAAGNYWLLDRRRDLAIIFFSQQVDGEDWNELGFDESKADISQAMKTILDSPKTLPALRRSQKSSSDGTSPRAQAERQKGFFEATSPKAKLARRAGGSKRPVS